MATREDFLAKFNHPIDAVAFEDGCLIAREFLSPAALAVLDGGEPTPEYWDDLIEQREESLLPVTLSVSDGHEQTEEGWVATVVAYCDDKEQAGYHGSINGSAWEAPDDLGVAYACIMLSGPGKVDETEDCISDALDALVADLEREGYAVMVEP